MARLSGFANIITTASTHNKELLTSLGATHVIDRKLNAGDILAKVRELTSGNVPLVYDSVSTAESQNLAADLVNKDGTLILTLPPTLDDAKKASVKNIHIVGGYAGLPPYLTLDLEFYNLLAPFLVSGEIKVSSYSI